MAYEENRDSLMKRKIVIIGGGASGLFLSSLIPEALLLEKNNTVGKKLSLTGGGKCNLTHEGEPRDTISHYYDKKRFISPSIYTFPPVKIREYFHPSPLILTFVLTEKYSLTVRKAVM